MRAALEAVRKPALQVTVFTDSCLGREGLAAEPTVPSGLELVGRIRRRAERFSDLNFSVAPNEGDEDARAERLDSDAMHSCRSD